MAAKINTTTNNLRIVASLALTAPNRDPIIPPNMTIIENGIKISKSIFNWPEIAAPVIPAAEFTQINKAEVAAIFFAEAHLFNIIIGDKKIPPPTPIIPLINPIPPPIGNEVFREGIFNLLTLFSVSILNIRNAAQIRTMESKVSYNVPSITKNPPNNAKGILVIMKGQVNFEI